MSNNLWAECQWLRLNECGLPLARKGRGSATTLRAAHDEALRLRAHCLCLEVREGRDAARALVRAVGNLSRRVLGAETPQRLPSSSGSSECFLGAWLHLRVFLHAGSSRYKEL